MVDSVNNNSNNNIIDLQSAQLGQSAAAASTQAAGQSTDSTAANAAGQKWIQDTADVSDAAQALLQKVRDAAVYSRQAIQTPESFDSDKVSKFKSMLDSGRINDYLGSLNNNDLASSILNSPAGTMFAS